MTNEEKIIEINRLISEIREDGKAVQALSRFVKLDDIGEVRLSDRKI
ncbi:hypothetical protein [Alkaliphilus sp. B6464]|nr:hypothetical protein [Alkaliphilus sp. B6464]QUH21750.1 hypothetical protein HYG84_17595 [Alkaliphilus sp. B6464]